MLYRKVHWFLESGNGFELLARVKTWMLFSSADNEYNYVPTHQEIVLSFDRELSFYLDTLTRNSYFLF